MLIGAVVAVLALAPARPVRPLLGAVLAAVTLDCAYALATRLFPGRIGSYDSLAVYRLSTPIGYWNGLGVFAAIGAVVALGFAARGTRPVTRALAAASLLVLVPTLYFTFSRGAWLAALRRTRRAVRARLATAAAGRGFALRPAVARARGRARVA